MTRRRRLRRRLLWAGVVLGLVMLVASVWLLSAVFWAHDRIRAAGRRLSDECGGRATLVSDLRQLTVTNADRP